MNTLYITAFIWLIMALIVLNDNKDIIEKCGQEYEHMLNPLWIRRLTAVILVVTAPYWFFKDLFLNITIRLALWKVNRIVKRAERRIKKAEETTDNPVN